MPGQRTEPGAAGGGGGHKMGSTYGTGTLSYFSVWGQVPARLLKSSCLRAADTLAKSFSGPGSLLTLGLGAMALGLSKSGEAPPPAQGRLLHGLRARS